VLFVFWNIFSIPIARYAHKPHFTEVVEATIKPLLLQGFFIGLTPFHLGLRDQGHPPPGQQILDELDGFLLHQAANADFVGLELVLADHDVVLPESSEHT